MATCDAKRGGAYGRRCCARMCSASLGWRRVRVTGHECDLEACCMQKRCSSARMKFQRLTTARLATDRPLVATMHCNTWPATRDMLAPAAWATAGAVPAALTAPDALAAPSTAPNTPTRSQVAFHRATALLLRIITPPTAPTGTDVRGATSSLRADVATPRHPGCTRACARGQCAREH